MVKGIVLNINKDGLILRQEDSIKSVGKSYLFSEDIRKEYEKSHVQFEALKGQEVEIILDDGEMISHITPSEIKEADIKFEKAKVEKTKEEDLPPEKKKVKINVFKFLQKKQLVLEKKGNYGYATWSDVWAEVKKSFPKSKYKVYENNSGMPYFYDKTGAFCKVGVTIKGHEHICFLPVLDFKHNPMKSEPYTLEKYGKQTKIEAYSTFDINTTIMRCMVKACALHGLGLYVFRGEDLPKTK